jgi:DNA repair protein RadC
MIGLEDCIAMCGLEPEEVVAICEHEHVGEVQAAALASYLLQQAHGAERIRTMFIEEIHKARNRGEVKHAAELVAALRFFLHRHPEAAVGMEVD